MKKKMLLFVGLFAFLSVLALHTYADSSGFIPSSTPDFSVSDNKNNSKDDSKNSSNDTSNKKDFSNTGNSGLINPPIADNPFFAFRQLLAPSIQTSHRHQSLDRRSLSATAIPLVQHQQISRLDAHHDHRVAHRRHC